MADFLMRRFVPFSCRKYANKSDDAFDHSYVKCKAKNCGLILHVLKIDTFKQV